MKRTLLCTLLISGSLYAYEPKAHEQWWHANCTEKITLYRQWYGDADTKERIIICKYLKNKEYQSILDVGCSLCSLFFAIKKEKVAIDYTGLEVTKAFVDRAAKFGIPVMHGSVEELPCKDDSYDCVYMRHVLEHLEYYEKAITQMIRVAKKEVIISFFKHPNNWMSDTIEIVKVDSMPLYHNQYNKLKIDTFVKQNPKVDSLKWDYIGSDYVLCITLK